MKNKRIFVKKSLNMMIDPTSIIDGTSHFMDLHGITASLDQFIPHWPQLTDSAISIDTTGSSSSLTAVCPAFGQAGWGPFCFLNGNPVFKAFDSFQEFIQHSVVLLHDFFENAGVKNAYGPSIILFTLFVRVVLFPLTYQQLASTQRTQALTPKVQEIKEKYPDDKDMQNQLTALLYQETKVNPLAGCLPALVQIPVFLSLYRSFTNLAAEQKLGEPFLWLPNLEGPVFGTRSGDWLTSSTAWAAANGPPLGWHDTLCYLTIPLLLVIAQTVSLKILTPPSEDPAVQKTQQILKYLPWMLGYFSISVPAGLGVYWITNNVLSTVSTVGIKEYFKRNPIKFDDVNLSALLDPQFIQRIDPSGVWGYTSMDDMKKDVDTFQFRGRARIPESFSYQQDSQA